MDNKGIFDFDEFRNVNIGEIPIKSVDGTFVGIDPTEGTGDMLKSIYDTNINGIVDNSERLNGELPSFYATDSLVVHLTGNETITGQKTFGTGDLIAPDITSSTDFTVNVGTDKTLKLVKTGDGYDWVHRFISLEPIAGVSAPGDVALPGNITLYANGFDGQNTLEELHTKNTFGMPHSYVEGQDIKLYIVSCGVNNNTGNIKWNVDLSYINLGDTSREMSATQTYSVILANPGLGTNGRCKFTDSIITISGANFNIGTNINMRVYRNPADAQDTYGSDALLQGVNFHIPVNQIGSSSELIK